jgi:prepilin signal peptidase PulO-like enzyme (type II secretory pathway)
MKNSFILSTMSETFAIICGGIGGALLGSFTTMLVWRLHNDEKGIWTGRSKCPKCKKILSALELIPLVSWLIQKGTCKKCGKKIPVFYPLVELVFIISGILFVQFFYSEIWWHMGLKLLLVFFALILWVYDTKFFEVDRRISWPAILLALFLAFVEGGIQSALIGGLIGFSLFAVQYFYSSGRWVGAGDMELGVFMGFALGWEKTIGALFIAYILGTIVAIPLLLLKKKNMKSSLPMGAFLMPAFLIMLHSGEKIIEWYMNFFIS